MINLGIKFKREGNQCERCKKFDTEVGKTTFHEEYDLLCCEKCFKETIEEKNLKCPRCRKVVGLDGLTEHRGKQMCYQCVKDAKRNEIRTEERKRFFKTNWKYWITTVLIIIGIVIGYIGLTSS